MPPVAAGAVALAAGLDLAVGEPPRRAHPVAWIGRVVGAADRPWSRPTLVGLLVAIVLPTTAGGLSGAAVVLAGGVHPIGAGVTAGLVLFAATSRRMLLETTRSVLDESETDLAAARSDLSALAGREADELTAGQVRSAAVESAAENLADGLVGPLLYFAVLAPISLPLATGAAAGVKTVNTIDSMLGYPSKPVGRAGARLDDVLMWLPARVAAATIALATVNPRALLAGRAWSHRPASPNSGVPMATLAAALDVRLEKPGAYVLNPAVALPSPERAGRGADAVGIASALAFVAAGVVAWF